jgi:hypothetical protein
MVAFIENIFKKIEIITSTSACKDVTSLSTPSFESLELLSAAYEI